MVLRSIEGNTKGRRWRHFIHRRGSNGAGALMVLVMVFAMTLTLMHP